MKRLTFRSFALAILASFLCLGLAIAQTATPLPTVPVPDQATWLAVLQMLGLSKYAASIIAVVGLFGFILTHIMPYIPVPAATAPAWWRSVYQALSWLSGNYFNQKPAPPAA